MRRIAFSLLVVLPLAKAEEPPPSIWLVPLAEGLRSAAPGGDPARLKETDVYREALEDGIDLDRPPHPVLVLGWDGQKLYYLFYRTTGSALGDPPYAIQRIKKIERTWKAADAAPEEKVTWQVEVFKTLGGELKKPDQHFGSFGLHGNHRREIVKEYEIGFGEIPGVCEGTDWPFDPGKLFLMLQAYQEDAALFEKVKFRRARRWTLAVSFDASGGHSVRSPELDFDAPTRPPARGQALPPADAASAAMVLVEGRGMEGIAIGQSAREDVVRALGEPVEDVAAGRGHTNLGFRGPLIVNLDPAGKVKTIRTGPGFSGRTGKGAAHGMYRDEVARLYGLPKDAAPDAADWRYFGVQFTFDSLDRVKRIVVLR
jgi:hypothetical protein